MFVEGKNMVENAKNELRFAYVSLLAFVAFVILFVLLSGFNLFYIGFMAVFLVGFLTIFIFLKKEKKRGIKQCIYAVQNSKTSNIVAKQIDTRKMSEAFVKSMSGTIDSYDENDKYPRFTQKLKRKRRHNHLVGAIQQFEDEDKKEI